MAERSSSSAGRRMPAVLQGAKPEAAISSEKGPDGTAGKVKAPLPEVVAVREVCGAAGGVRVMAAPLMASPSGSAMKPETEPGTAAGDICGVADDAEGGIDGSAGQAAALCATRERPPAAPRIRRSPSLAKA